MLRVVTLMPLYQAVRGYALVWPVIRGVTRPDYSLDTGFSSFNLPTPKGRDHSHVDSGKHIYIYICVGFLLCLFVCCCCLLSITATNFTVHVPVCGKLWGVCI